VMIGKVIGGIGVGFTVIDVIENDVTIENSVDLMMGVAGFFPLTASISMAYFGGKLIFKFGEAVLNGDIEYKNLDLERAYNGWLPLGPLY
jgi:hypothetical protein